MLYGLQPGGGKVAAASGPAPEYELMLARYWVCVCPDDREMCSREASVTTRAFLIGDIGYGLQ